MKRIVDKKISSISFHVNHNLVVFRLKKVTVLIIYFKCSKCLKNNNTKNRPIVTVKDAFKVMVNKLKHYSLGSIVTSWWLRFND